MDIINHTDHVEIKVQLDLYSITVLHKCFYWYGANFSVDIETESDKVGRVRLFPKTEIPVAEYPNLLSKIRNDLIDFKTRDIVSKETQNVRDLLIAKAFSHSDELDDSPPGDISDPVGFDPTAK